LTPYKWGRFRGWYAQYGHLRQSLKLAGPMYNMYVRARLDTLFVTSILDYNLQLNYDTILAVKEKSGLKVPGGLSEYKDWFYVTNYEGMFAISDTSTYSYNLTARCYGVCPEEQVGYHIKTHNFSFKPLIMHLNLERKNCVVRINKK